MAMVTPSIERSQSLLDEEQRSNPFTLGNRSDSATNPFSDDATAFGDLSQLDQEDIHAIVNELGLDRVGQPGREITARCPFPENHWRGDHNPSFSISTVKPGFPWHCWSCGAKGSLWSLFTQLGEPLTRLEHYGVKFRTTRQKSENNWRGAGRVPRAWNTYLQRKWALAALDRGPRQRIVIRRWIQLRWEVKKSQANNILRQMIRRGMVYEDQNMLYSVRYIDRNGGQLLNTKTGNKSYSGIQQSPALRLCVSCKHPLSGSRNKLYCDNACCQKAYRDRVRSVRPKPIPPPGNIVQHVKELLCSGKTGIEARNRLDVVSKRQNEISDQLVKRKRMRDTWKLHDDESVATFIGDATGLVYQLRSKIVSDALGLDGPSTDELRMEYAALDSEWEQLREVVYS